MPNTFFPFFVFLLNKTVYITPCAGPVAFTFVTSDLSNFRKSTLSLAEETLIFQMGYIACDLPTILL